MKLVVGLGNPGERHADTRHNVGFRVLERLALDLGIDTWQSAFGGRLARGTLARGADSEFSVALLAPQTYMNRSGDSVAEAVAELPIHDPARDLLVVLDDVDLPFGRLRVRPGGGSGGHRGLASVIDRLEASDFARLRFGIGRPEAGSDTVAWVLQQFSDAERAGLAESIPLAARVVAEALVDGVTVAMNRYNHDPATQG